MGSDIQTIRHEVGGSNGRPKKGGELAIPEAWRPQRGPQLDAIQADWCEELAFGGAKFGGKSDFLLGDFLQGVPEYKENWHGILIRESMPELEDIIRRSHEIYGPAGAEWGEQKKTWTFPDGSSLKMRQLSRYADFLKYNGHSYCVGVGTPILMGDKSSKPIEQIKIGEEVMTLQGPRRVLATLAPYLADCIKVCNVFGEQIQPESHPLLSRSGWRSYEDVLTPTWPLFLYRYRELFGENNLISLMPLLMSQKDRKLVALLLFGSPFDSALPYVFGGDVCARLGQQKALGFLLHYLAYHRFYGGKPLCHLGSALNDTPLQAGVVEPCHVYYMPDAMDDILGHSQPGLLEYEHPYTEKVFLATEESVCVPCYMSSVGKEAVCDIQVEEVNHYISADTFLVNKNTWIGFDEIAQFADERVYHLMKGCLRWGGAEVPTKRIRCSCNPFGPGVSWVKRYFVDQAPTGYKPRTDPDTKHNIMFIPSRVLDNKMGLEMDPGYISRLKGMGSKEVVKAMLEGDFSAVVGAFFDEFSIHKHVIEPVELPEHLMRFRAFDWGSYHPFYCLWVAVSDGTIPGIKTGALICYREYYGCKPDKPTEGIKMPANEVAKEIVRREFPWEHRNISFSVADTQVFESDGGPSIAERMQPYIYWQGADKKRKPGWDQVRQRLIGIDGKPMVLIFSTCKHLIRTLPALQHDDRDPNDADTNGEDHPCDALRYACMARPWVAPSPEPEKPMQGMDELTWNDLMGDLTNGHY